MIRLPHLETEITQACQLSCVACNHAVPLWRAHEGGPWRTTPEQVYADLSHLARFTHASLWGALGGEPLLHPDLIEILQAVRSTGIADRLEVWTNGILLARQPVEFWDSFDVLVLSVYENRHSPQSITWIKNKCDDEGKELVIKDERIHPNFRTWLEPRPTSPGETGEKYRKCFFRSYCRNASYGYFFTCCCGPHIPMLVQGRPFGTDGVKIEGSTEKSIRAYLSKSEPLSACTVCAGRDTAQPIKWHEERDPSRWLRHSAGLGDPS